MAITTQMRTDVANLYTALFGRAPERDGLGYWVNELNAGKTVAQVAQAMYATEPARAYYPTFLTNDEIIGRFYTNVLGRTADADGLAYWSAKLTAGATQGAVISEMITAVTAYAGTDAAAVSSKALFENKVTVGLYYAVDLGGNDIAKATSVLSTVTADAATVTAAKAAASTTAGSSYALTTASDAITGTSGNDTITGYTSATAALVTFNAADVIDGGAGTDTLSVILDGANASAAIIKNVETISLRAVTANTFDAGSATGVTTIVADGGSALATVDNIKALTTAAKVANSAGGANFKYTDSLVTGSADAASLTVDGVTGGTITLGNQSAAGGFETINLTASGAASKAFTLTESGTTLTKVTVAGDKTVGLTVSDASITTLDASANTAGVDVDARALTGTFTITGTAKNDRVVVDNANTSSADTVTGGDGTDTLAAVVAGGATYTHSGNTKVTGFETFELVDAANVATNTVTAALGGSFSAVKTSGGNAGDDTYVFTGVANNSTLTISESAAAVTSTLHADTSADTLSIVLDGVTTTGAVTAGGVETVNVTSQADSASAANTLNSLTTSAATTLNIKGAFTANLGTVTTAANSTVSAADFTGTTLTASFTGAVVKNFTGSAGKDLITIASDSLNSSNTFAGGAGSADTLTDGGVTGNQGIINVTGFETVTATLAAAAVIDVRNVTDMTKLVINSTADSITVDRLNVTTTAVTLDATAGAAETIAAATFTANSGTTLGLTFNSNDAADTITTLTLDNGLTGLTLTVDGATAGTDKLVVTNAISSLGLTSMTVKGDGLATFSGTQSANLVSFDASASTGAQSITLGATTGTTTMLGGTGNDTLAGGASADTINGNGGADTLTGTTGANKYVIDSAAEARGTTYAGTVVTATANIETITTFVATGSADTIQLGLGVDAFGSGISLTTATNVVVTNIGALATADRADLAAVMAAAQANTAGTASTSATLQVYSFTIAADATTGGDFDSTSAGTYIVINDGTAALAATDTIIRVGTLTGTLATTDFVFA